MDPKKLAVIHIVKKELGLSDDEYRGILRRQAGVSSATELDEEKFRKLMNFFVRSPYYRVNKEGLTLKQKLYIKFLVKELGWKEGHFANFLHKYYHKDKLDNISKKEAIKVIESLKAIGEHRHGG